jgi:lipopolysaccharide/colanic/teichoic acid biosynthesis glycosyltransferase
MGKHEIRLHKQKTTARGSERYRDFNTVVSRHKRDVRFKKMIRLFTILSVVLVVLMLIFMTVVIFIKLDKNKMQQKPVASVSSLIIKSH